MRPIGFVLSLALLASAPPASADEAPWMISVSAGSPGIFSFGLQRRFADELALLVEAGTFPPFPALLTAGAHLEGTVVAGETARLFAGATAAVFHFWFTGYEGEGEPITTYGVGPKLGGEVRFPTMQETHVVLQLEVGALYGEWRGYCEDCRAWAPLATLRLGYTF